MRFRGPESGHRCSDSLIGPAGRIVCGTGKGRGGNRITGGVEISGSCDIVEAPIRIVPVIDDLGLIIRGVIGYVFRQTRDFTIEIEIVGRRGPRTVATLCIGAQVIRVTQKITYILECQ